MFRHPTPAAADSPGRMPTLAWRFTSVAVLACLLAAPAAARADADAARKALTDASKSIADGNFDQADTGIKTAEAELDSVAAGDKPAVTKEIAAAKAALAAAQVEVKQTAVLGKIDVAMRDAKSSMTGSAESASKSLDEVEALLASPDAKAAVDEKTAAGIRGQVATLRKVAGAKLADGALATLGPKLDEMEKTDLPDLQKALSGDNAFEANNASDRFKGKLTEAAEALKAVPDDKPEKKALQARYDKLSAGMAAAVGKGNRDLVVERTKREWASVKEHFAGWDAEKSDLSYEQVRTQRPAPMKLEKTAEAISRIDDFLGGDAVKKDFTDLKDDADMKAITAEAAKIKADAARKIADVANRVADEAGKETDKSKQKSDDLNLFAGDIDRALKSTEHAGLAPKLTAIAEKWRGADAADDAGKQKLYETLTAKAAAGWPDIVKAYSGAVDSGTFDPTKADDFKGKQVRFKDVQNRLGWDFSPGPYAFATSVNGRPVAAKYAPGVEAAVKDVLKRTSRELPEENWDLVATYDGTTGRIDRRVSADVRTTGGENVGTVTGHDTVDNVPVLQIVALHVGPVAVGADGAVNETGTVAPVAGVAAAGGAAAGGYLARIVWLVIALAAAVTALVKAQVAGVAMPAGAHASVGDAAGKVTAMAGNALAGQNLPIAGLVFAGLGAWQLLAGLVVYDLLPAVALMAAGVYASADWLVARGIMPANTAATLRPLGIKIAAACAGLAVVHLLVGGWPLV